MGSRCQGTPPEFGNDVGGKNEGQRKISEGSVILSIPHQAANLFGYRDETILDEGPAWRMKRLSSHLSISWAL
jgi:hypothetical protein